MNEDLPKPTKKRNSRGEDYVNNKEFSLAVAEYVKSSSAAKNKGSGNPPITNYIATCLMKIANGLARSPNFMNYSYRDDMIMDAVENCIKAIYNYNIEAGTRSGVPNAFGYFTQISYFAFLRRIAKEKKQANIKQLLIDRANIGEFAEFDDDLLQIGETLIEKIRQKNDAFYKDENEVSDDSVKSKSVPKKVTNKIGPLSQFIS